MDNNEDTNKEEDVSRYVLCMMMFGGLLGGGLIGGCGEDAAPGGGGNEGEGQGEGEGEGDTGEGEGEGPLPPGGDGEPCDDGNTCQDGYECMTCYEANLNDCDGSVCTCPQIFEGTWFAEYTDVRAVDYEYDFTAGSGDRELWGDREFEIQQTGCALVTTERNTALRGGDGVSGGHVNPPDGFRYRSRTRSVDAGDRWNEWVGLLSPDRRTITGTCDGEYADGMKEPAVWFHITCSFTLTRRE